MIYAKNPFIFFRLLIKVVRPKDRLTYSVSQAVVNPNLATVEHSICQPGLPLPHGDSQYGS